MKTKTKTKKAIATTVKKYADGGKMKLSDNLTESRKTMASKKALLKKTRKSTKNMRKMVAITGNVRKMVVGSGDDGDVDRSPILFNTEMRRTFIKGVLQDIKGYFESKTDGKVEVSYEDHGVGSHEFGFKLKIKRGLDCSKQMFSEASAAVCNIVNYMLPADEFEKFDLTTFTEDELVAFEILSNW